MHSIGVWDCGMDGSMDKLLRDQQGPEMYYTKETPICQIVRMSLQSPALIDPCCVRTAWLSRHVRDSVLSPVSFPRAPSCHDGFCYHFKVILSCEDDHVLFFRNFQISRKHFQLQRRQLYGSDVLIRQEAIRVPCRRAFRDPRQVSHNDCQIPVQHKHLDLFLKNRHVFQST